MDTQRWELRLPQEKLSRIQLLVASWRCRKSCTKKELLSLIGLLQHACRVVRAGRSFLRRMINLSSVAREPHHHIRLSVGARSDIEWWATFLPQWNGVSLMGSDSHAPPRLVVTSDASGSRGCGAFSSKGEWFQLPWPEAWDSIHITCKELLPIVLACAVWGRGAEGGVVQCRTDNAAVVSIVNTGRSKDNLAMHLMRCLSFFMARFAIIIRAEHVPGRDNVTRWSMTDLPCSTHRCQWQQLRQHNYQQSCWTCWYTLAQIGPRSAGALSSMLFFERFSTFDTTYI